VHLRRALLLFAIVLGLAALATSVSRPLERRSPAIGEQPPAALPPRPEAPPAARLRFSTSPPRERRRLEPGRAAVVVVRADQPGQVDLEGLGMSAPADPFTPARFDVLATRPVTAVVRFTPAGAGAAEVVGTLALTSRGSARSGERSARKTEPDR
jgi:hypothetical protein